MTISSAQPEPRPRRRRKEARPVELAEAALQLFAEKGYAATRLEDVAARAGVSKGTVYLYYVSKEALFDDVIRRAVLPVLERGEYRIERHTGSAVTLLEELMRDWLHLMLETPLGRIPKLIVADADKFPEQARVFHDSVILRARRMIRRLLAFGIERGEFSIDDIDTTAELLHGMVLMAAIERASIGLRYGPAGDPERHLDTLMKVIVQGISSPAARRRIKGKAK